MDTSPLPACAFNQIPSIEEACAIMPQNEDLLELAHLFVQHDIHHSWGIGLFHRHTTLPDGCIMLHNPGESENDDICTIKRLSDLDQAVLSPSALCLNPNGQLQGFEYDTHPRPAPGSDFAHHFHNVLTRRSLLDKVAIVAIDSIEGSMLECVLADSDGRVYGTRSALGKWEDADAVDTVWKVQADGEVVSIRGCRTLPTGLHEVYH